jgi:hypothetical protein
MKLCVRYLSLTAIACLLGVGCAETNKPTTQPSSVRERQDAAMQDPFGYGGSTEKIDITGGGVSDFDRKAFKRDVDSVMNP